MSMSCLFLRLKAFCFLEWKYVFLLISVDPLEKKNAFECSEQFWVEGTKPRFCNVYGNSIKCKRY